MKIMNKFNKNKSKPLSDNQSMMNWIMKVTVATLSSICVVVVIALLAGLFMPNDVIDNKDIFPIIGPAFNMVIGAFVGLLGGLTLAKKDK